MACSHPKRRACCPRVAPLFAEMRLGLGMGPVGTVLAMLFVFFCIVGAGVSVVVSESLGGRRRNEADRTALATLGAISWFGVVCMLLAVAGAEPLLRLLNAPPKVLPLAVPSLRWLAPAAGPGATVG